jgi:CheY-like chemotaxis protein
VAEPPALMESTRQVPQERKVDRRKVLVVEDNRDAAESLCFLLEVNDFEVEAAYTGPEGVEKARRFQPDIILCDIGLPGLDGYGVAKAIRDEQPHLTPLLIEVTGYGQEEDKIRSKEAGFDRHLVKPVDAEKLLLSLQGAQPEED